MTPSRLTALGGIPLPPPRFCVFSCGKDQMLEPGFLRGPGLIRDKHLGSGTEEGAGPPGCSTRPGIVSSQLQCSTFGGGFDANTLTAPPLHLGSAHRKQQEVTAPFLKGRGTRRIRMIQQANVSLKFTPGVRTRKERGWSQGEWAGLILMPFHFFH